MGNRQFFVLSWTVVLTAPVAGVRADELIYAYEGEVMPWLDGWIGHACSTPCSQKLHDGHLVFEWSSVLPAPYRYPITSPPQADPPSLWAEWSFRSNFLLGPVFYGCDVFFHVDYASLEDGTYMDGDAAISFSGDDYVLGLDPEEFHTYRFESPDGMRFAQFRVRCPPRTPPGLW